MIEYINPRDPIVIPDFFLAASLDVLMALYHGLYQRSVEGKSFHWSTHIDHGLSIVDLTLRGVIRETQSMSKATFDFVVWRGVPRYLLSTLTEQTFAFDSLLNIPQELDFPKALASAAA